MEQELTVEVAFNDPERIARYSEGPARAIPGFATLHRIIVQLLSERLGGTGRVLVVGAGGGMELLSFATARPGWTLVGVDPSKPMLDQARQLLGERAHQVELRQGYIADAPSGPFDAATCLLTLWLLRDDGTKLDALCAIRDRLRPGAPFIIVDNCIGLDAPDADVQLQRFAQFGVDSGNEAQQMEAWKRVARSTLGLISPAREEALLAEAGFCGAELFFAGLSWRGWVAYA